MHVLCVATAGAGSAERPHPQPRRAQIAGFLFMVLTVHLEPIAGRTAGDLVLAKKSPRLKNSFRSSPENMRCARTNKQETGNHGRKSDLLNLEC